MENRPTDEVEPSPLSPPAPAGAASSDLASPAGADSVEPGLRRSRPFKVFIAAGAVTGFSTALLAFRYWADRNELLAEGSDPLNMLSLGYAIWSEIMIVVEAVSLGTVAVLVAGRSRRLVTLLAGYVGIVVGMGVALALPVVLGQAAPGEADLGSLLTMLGIGSAIAFPFYFGPAVVAGIAGR